MGCISVLKLIGIIEEGGQKTRRELGSHGPLDSSLQPQRLQRPLAFEGAFCSLKYLMKARGRPGKGRSLNLLASLLKRAALRSVTKSSKALGGLVVALGAPRRRVLSSGQVGAGLSATCCSDPSWQAAALSLLKLSLISGMKHFFLWSALVPPPALDLSIFSFRCSHRAEHTSSLGCDLFVNNFP